MFNYIRRIASSTAIVVLCAANGTALGGPGTDHYFGMPHTPTGNAVLSTGPGGGLLVSNIGSSGQDGVSIELGKTTGYAIQFDPGPSGALPRGMQYNISAPVSIDGGEGVDTRIVANDTGQAELSLDMTGLSPLCVHVRLLLDDVVVDSRVFPLPLPSVLVTGSFGGDSSGSPMTFEVECDAESLSVFGFQPVRVQAAASIVGSPTGPVQCDQVQFLVDGMPPDASRYITGASLQCANIPGGTVVVTEEFLRVRLKGWDGTIKGNIRAMGDAHVTAVGPPDICAGCPECCEPDGGDSLAMHNGVTVSNIGLTGLDGATFSCRPWGSPWFVSDLRFATSPIDFNNDGTDTVGFAAFGQFQGAINQQLGTCRLQNNPATVALDLYANFSAIGSDEVTIECRNGGAFAGAAVTQGGPGVVVGSLRSAGGPVRLTGCGKLGGTTPCYFMEFEVPVLFLSNDGTVAVICDEVRVLASNASGPITTVDSFTIRASGIEPFTMTQRQCCITDGWQLMGSGLVHEPIGQASIALADVTGDGIPDVVCSNIGSSGNDGVSIDLGQSQGAIWKLTAGSPVALQQWTAMSFDIYDDQCPMCPGGVVTGLEFEPSSASQTQMRSKCPECPHGHVTLLKREMPPSTFTMSSDVLTISADSGSTLLLEEVGASARDFPAGYNHLTIQCSLGEDPPDPTSPGVTVTDAVAGTFTNVDQIVITYCMDESDIGTIERATLTAAAGPVCNPCSFALSRSSVVQHGNAHSGLGQARIVSSDCDDSNDAFGPVLWVANIGSSGNDGVSISLPGGDVDEDCDGDAEPDATGITIRVRPDADLAVTLSYTAIGTFSDGSTSDLSALLWDASNPASAPVVLSGCDWMTSPTVTVTVRDQFDNVVQQVSGMSLGDIGTVSPAVAPSETLIEVVLAIAVGLANDETVVEGMRHMMTWDSPVSMQLPGQSSVMGSSLEVLVEPLDGRPVAQQIEFESLDVHVTASKGSTVTYGIESETITRFAPPPCPADIAPSPPGGASGDGTVNVLDLLAVIGGWGPCAAPCPPNCTADLNDDCTVNVLDLLATIGGWGPCPTQ